jgi:hypothetical protein
VGRTPARTSGAVRAERLRPFGGPERLRFGSLLDGMISRSCTDAGRASRMPTRSIAERTGHANYIRACTLPNIQPPSNGFSFLFTTVSESLGTLRRWPRAGPMRTPIPTPSQPPSTSGADPVGRQPSTNPRPCFPAAVRSWAEPGRHEEVQREPFGADGAWMSIQV